MKRRASKTGSKRGCTGKCRWMENHFDKRLDPRLLVDGAKSVISLLLNYYPSAEVQQPADTLQISKYAYGRDYHFVIKDKLKTLLADMQAQIGEVGGRCFVDSAPVLDKAWAKRGGLGWVGKNSNLITPRGLILLHCRADCEWTWTTTMGPSATTAAPAPSASTPAHAGHH